jgi:hypothetical protein
MSNRWQSLRYACVCYRDPVDEPGLNKGHEVHDFTDDPLDISQFLNDVEAEGGGDVPEDFVGAVNCILKLDWRENARRSIFWIADAPAHGMRYSGDDKHQEQEAKLEPLIQDLAEKDIRLMAVLLNDTPRATFEIFREIYHKVAPHLTFEIADDFCLQEVPLEPTADNIARTLDSRVLGAEMILLRDLPRGTRPKAGGPA